MQGIFAPSLGTILNMFLVSSGTKSDSQLIELYRTNFYIGDSVETLPEDYLLSAAGVSGKLINE